MLIKNGDIDKQRHEKIQLTIIVFSLLYLKSMKQKSDSPLTKSVFKQELGAFEKRMDKRFITKDYLNSTIDMLLQGIRREFTFAIEGVVEKFNEKLNKHTSLILTTVDPLLKELETRREDQAIATSQHSKLRNQFDNHEKRIVKLEHIQQTA